MTPARHQQAAQTSRWTFGRLSHRKSASKALHGHRFEMPALSPEQRKTQLDGFASPTSCCFATQTLKAASGPPAVPLATIVDTTFSLDLRFRFGSELQGNQFGKFGRDIRHRIFCSTQTTSRPEQWADFTESFVRRVVHDGNQHVTSE